MWSSPAMLGTGVHKQYDLGTFEWPQPIGCASIEEFLDQDGPGSLEPCNLHTSAEDNLIIQKWKANRKGIDPDRVTCVIDIDASTSRAGYMVGCRPCLTCSR